MRTVSEYQRFHFLIFLKNYLFIKHNFEIYYKLIAFCILNTIFEKSEKDLRSVDAKVVEILDDPEVEKLMIVLQTIK